tara:strand:+ start:152 stop:955 length:804 start_codon:yes stop_codon:yes gene_type:complete
MTKNSDKIAIVNLNSLEINKIYNEDCLETMKKMPDDFVDLVLTSPPFNIRPHEKFIKDYDRRLKGYYHTKYGGLFDELISIEDYLLFQKKVINELLRVSKIIFYEIQLMRDNRNAIFSLIYEYKNNLKEIITLSKTNPQPTGNKGVLMKQSKLVLVFDKYNSQSMQYKIHNFDDLGNHWNIEANRKHFNYSKEITKIHNATFSEKFASIVIENFSNKNALIYDCFSGTGTTSVAAKRLKRNFIGSEIVKEFYDISNKRINNLQGLLI